MYTKNNDTKSSFIYDVPHVIDISAAWQIQTGGLFLVGSHVTKPVDKKTYLHSILTH